MSDPRGPKPPVNDTAPAVLRLARFRIDHPVMPAGPPMHSLGVVTCDNPDNRIVGWSLEIRGAAAFLVSPRGYAQNKHATEFDPKGRITVVGPIPMAHVTCVWEGDDVALIDKLQRFSTPPFARVAPVVYEEKPVDPKEMGDA